MRDFSCQLKITDWINNAESYDIDFKVIGSIEDNEETLMQVSLRDEVMTTHPDFWIDLGKTLIKYGKMYKK